MKHPEGLSALQTLNAMKWKRCNPPMIPDTYCKTNSRGVKVFAMADFAVSYNQGIEDAKKFIRSNFYA